jgi:hypothetical protein
MKYYLVLFLLYILCVHSAIEISPQSRLKKANFKNNLKNKCDLCLEKTGDKCNKCIKGAYLFEHDCYFTCPGETVADNYSLTCKNESDNPVFIKAYTLGRCLNKCGSVFHDCSCNIDCKKAGNCCSDFKYCEFIGKEASKQCTISGCEACTQDNKTCLKCKDRFYYYKNQCVEACPHESKRILGNSLCIDIPKCNIENCAECDKVNLNCTKCLHGYFLHENECTESCPAGTRANRVNFTCVNKSTFAFSMIFPSKFSCKSQCGLEKAKLRKLKIKNMTLETNCQNEDKQYSKQDCSCHHHCLKDGNCCDDFESECIEELKKEKCKTCENCHEGKCLKCLENSELHQGDCNCRKGFYYDIEKDRCLDINLKTQKSNQEKLQIKNPSQNNNSILSKMLADSFHSPNKEDSFKQSLQMPGLGYNMVLSGNTTMNIFSGNDHPIITNESVVNENSFNNSTKIEKNINSHNIIIGGYQRENIKEEDGQFENPQNYYPDKQDDSESNLSFGSPRYETTIRDSKGRMIKRLINNRQSERKKKIIIDKHFHMDHEKNYPHDLEHEEGVPMTMKELLKNSSNNEVKKIKSSNQVPEPKVLGKKGATNVPKQEVLTVKSASGAVQLKTKNLSQFAEPIGMKNVNLENNNSFIKEIQPSIQPEKINLIKEQPKEILKNNNFEKEDKTEPENLQISTPLLNPASSQVKVNPNENNLFNNQNTNSNQYNNLNKSETLQINKQKKHNTFLKEILSEKKSTIANSHPVSQTQQKNNILELNKVEDQEKENQITLGTFNVNQNNIKIQENNNLKSSISQSQTFSKENNINFDKKPLSQLTHHDLDHLVETTTDSNKKVQVNINIPNSTTDEKNPNVLHRNRVVVYNHYFINDKSMTMNQPKNPNVFNFFGNECKDGKCLNSDESKPFKDAQFINDKNFKEFNNTLHLQKGGVNVIMDRGTIDEQFKLPESQKSVVSEDLKDLKQGSNRLKQVLIKNKK